MEDHHSELQATAGWRNSKWGSGGRAEEGVVEKVVGQKGVEKATGPATTS